MGVVIPRHGAALGQELANRLLQGQVRLKLGLLTGENRVWWAPVLEVRSRSRTVLTLEAVGQDLAFEPPARSHLLRLRRPILRFGPVLPSRSGTPVQIAAGLRADTLWAVWSGPGRLDRSV